MKNIIGQSVYMIAVLMVILMAGEYFIPEDCYVKNDSDYQNVEVLLICNVISIIIVEEPQAMLELEGDIITIEVKIKKVILTANFILNLLREFLDLADTTQFSTQPLCSFNCLTR